MGRAGPRRVKAYSREFKLKAVQLSGQPGVLIKDVAESLCIHPFMLSRWRKQVRDGEVPPLSEFFFMRHFSFSFPLSLGFVVFGRRWNA